MSESSEHPEYTLELKRIITEVATDNARLRATLHSIAEHPHCHWNYADEDDWSTECGTGSISGHRCAAEIARKALEAK